MDKYEVIHRALKDSIIHEKSYQPSFTFYQQVIRSICEYHEGLIFFMMMSILLLSSSFVLISSVILLTPWMMVV